MRMLRASLVLLATSALVVTSAFGASAAFPGSNGRIAFSSTTFRRADILSIEPDGSGLSNVTKDVAGGWLEASWSSDGARLAVVGYPGRHTALITVDADGTDPTTLTNEIGPRLANFSSPTWSPDGTRIAFCVQGFRPDALARIYVIGADGTGLTRISPKGTSECDPAWSPDGTRIAFVRSFAHRRALETMDPDGANPATVVGKGRNGKPDWSPDGTTLVFERFGAASSDLFTILVAGGPVTRLTSTPRLEVSPVFSPDGTKVAFSAGTIGRRLHLNIWTMNLDGTGLARVTDFPASRSRVIEAPDWQPI
jgi:Tol biopolymer transport system component